MQETKWQQRYRMFKEESVQKNFPKGVLSGTTKAISHISIK